MRASPDLLWTPAPADVEAAEVTRFRHWIEAAHDVVLPDLDALWRWSVADIAGFWEAIWNYFGLTSPTPYNHVLTGAMPDARWFEGATLNYAEQVFRNETDSFPAIVECHEDQEPHELSWAELRRQVAGLATTFTGLGVGPGDRVAGYVSNRSEAVVALLATASIGAIWTSCAPDFGIQSALARFGQVQPTVLVAVGRYRFAGKLRDRMADLAEFAASIESLRATVLIDGDPDDLDPARVPTVSWIDAVRPEARLEFAATPFGHPLWILFSSGTTGLPKGIVHSHGGIVVEHTKSLALGVGLRPGQRFFFFSSTSWMVWNYLVGGLLVGATPVVYDGSPTFPDVIGSWRITSSSRAAVAGMGAAYITACQKANASPADALDVSALQVVQSTGSPLPTAGWRWLHERLPGVRIDCTSGGTDVCSTFVGGSPVLPVHIGEIPGRALGVNAEAWNPSGQSVIDEVGELVITEPMPSMPTGFWNDPDGRRYRDAYFAGFPGVWKHGDWVRISSRGTVVIEGRSDSTLNRGGVRMGSAEIYAAVEGLPAIADSLVVGVELPEGAYYMALFVVPAPGRTLDDDLRTQLTEAIRTGLSPRHVPDDVIAAPAIPRTLTGKKLEVPIKRLLQGRPLDDVVDMKAVDDATALRWFASFAEGRQPSTAGAPLARSSNG
jgi:acetoacetyl-CoA synthetase